MATAEMWESAKICRREGFTVSPLAGIFTYWLDSTKSNSRVRQPDGARE